MGPDRAVENSALDSSFQVRRVKRREPGSLVNAESSMNQAYSPLQYFR
jgi:hypothetical protein